MCRTAVLCSLLLALATGACSSDGDGSGTTTSVTDPPAASVTSDDGVLAVEVPDGQLDGAATVVEGSAELRAELEEAGATVLGLYDVGPSPSTFDEPATLTFTLARAALAEGVAVVVRDADGSWEVLADLEVEADGDTATVSARTTHFSDFAALRAPVVPTMAPSAVQIATGTSFEASLRLDSHAGGHAFGWISDAQDLPPTAIGEDSVEYQSSRPPSGIDEGEWRGTWTCELAGDGTYGYVGTSTIESVDRDREVRELADLIGANEWTIAYEALGEADCQVADVEGPGGSSVAVADRRCVDAGTGDPAEGCAEASAVEVETAADGTVELVIALAEPLASDGTAQVEMFRYGDAPFALTCRSSGACDLYSGVGFVQEDFDGTVTFRTNGSSAIFEGLPLGIVAGGGPGIRLPDEIVTSIGVLGPGLVPLEEVTVAIQQGDVVGSTLLDLDSLGSALTP